MVIEFLCLMSEHELPGTRSLLLFQCILCYHLTCISQVDNSNGLVFTPTDIVAGS